MIIIRHDMEPCLLKYQLTCPHCQTILNFEDEDIENNQIICMHCNKGINISKIYVYHKTLNI